jgi:hypothetical protein
MRLTRPPTLVLIDLAMFPISWFTIRNFACLVAGWIAQTTPYDLRYRRSEISNTGEITETETLSLNTNELPYALVNSIKELLMNREEVNRQIEDQKKQVRKLEHENIRLIEEVELLKRAVRLLKAPSSQP